MDLAVVALVGLGALAAFAAAIGAMALGSRLTGRCLRGSCGGPDVRGADGERISCAGCPNRAR
jgi:hypothetical protein